MGEKNPQLCWTTNVDTTKNLIDIALNSKQRPWILYASSREVYGQKEHLPIHESASLEPVNIYGKSKAEAEKLIFEARARGLQVAVVRYSNVYGSTMDHPDRVIPAFCKAAAEGKELYVEGRDNLFDFTHLDDTIKGTLSLISLLILGRADLPPIHLTTGRPTSLNQAAEIALRSGKPEAKIIEAQSRTFDVSKFYGDTSLAQQILRWKSLITIEEGMSRLIQAYQLQKK
jgi:nucleoside-diphosphate-sugar epimerase